MILKAIGIYVALLVLFTFVIARCLQVCSHCDVHSRSMED